MVLVPGSVAHIHMADCLERYPAFKNVMLGCLESNAEPAQRILALETFALICRSQRKRIETMGKTWFQEKVVNSLKVGQVQIMPPIAQP